MSLNAGMTGSWSKGRKTATAGTVIVVTAPPRRHVRTKLTKVAVTVAGTAHTLTVMSPCNFTTLSADAAAAQAVVNITLDPGLYAADTANFPKTPSVANNAIVGGDYVVIELPDGNYFQTTVSSVSTLAITLTDNVPTGGVKSGAKFWFYGIGTDLNPHTGEAHPIFTLAASATATLTAEQGSVVETPGIYQPLVLLENNATAAATVEYAQGVYAQ